MPCGITNESGNAFQWWRRTLKHIQISDRDPFNFKRLPMYSQSRALRDGENVREARVVVTVDHNLSCRPPRILSMAESSKQALLSSEGFEEYNTKLQTAALKATRNAALLPADLNFYRSLDRGLAKEVDTSSSRVVSLANRILHLVSTGQNTSKSKGKARLENDDDVTDSFRSLVVDAMDQLLERAVSQYTTPSIQSYIFFYCRIFVLTRPWDCQNHRPSKSTQKLQSRRCACKILGNSSNKFKHIP